MSHENRADGADWRGLGAAALCAGAELQKLYAALEVEKSDVRVTKNRYSAFIRSDFDKLLKERGIDTLLVAGTKPNVCVECTAAFPTTSIARRSKT